VCLDRPERDEEGIIRFPEFRAAGVISGGSLSFRTDTAARYSLEKRKKQIEIIMKEM
jgi:hypothetical protein